MSRGRVQTAHARRDCADARPGAIAYRQLKIGLRRVTHSTLTRSRVVGGACRCTTRLTFTVVPRLPARRLWRHRQYWLRRLHPHDRNDHTIGTSRLPELTFFLFSINRLCIVAPRELESMRTLSVQPGS